MRNILFLITAALGLALASCASTKKDECCKPGDKSACCAQ